jgi:glutathione S-transferase
LQWDKDTLSADDFLGQVSLGGYKLAQIADGQPHELELQPHTDETVRNTFVKGKVTVKLSLQHHEGNTIRIAAATPRPADTPVIHVYAKASVIEDGRFDTTLLGDCPFCHRVLMTIYEKHLPVEVTLIDLNDKPEWFAEMQFSATPVIEFDGMWMDDSEKIAAFLEEKFPEPSLLQQGVLTEKNGVFASVGSGCFPAFVQLLKAYTVLGHEMLLEEKQAAFAVALLEVDAQLQASGEGGGMYLGGDSVCNVDLALFPMLLHAKAVLSKVCGWEFPADLTAVSGYLSAMALRPACSKCYYSDELIVNGWQKHVREWQAEAGGAVIATLGNKICVKTVTGVQLRMTNEV